MHCHIAGKYGGSASWICNINLRLTKKVLVIFHDLWRYDSHLMIMELGKFDVKVNVIPNGLEKYLAFTISNKYIFIDSMQFMKFSLDALVRNFSETYLSIYHKSLVVIC